MGTATLRAFTAPGNSHSCRWDSRTMKKALSFLAIIILLCFIYFCIEHLLYTQLLVESSLYYLFFVLFLLTIPLFTTVLVKLKYYGKIVSSITVLASIGIGLVGLKFFIM
jgi:hypothetical protein